MFILLSTLWFIWMLKYILFWLYLWQLKEYHLGRFIDHFRTHKGKRLLFDLAQIFKFISILILLFYNNIFFVYLLPIIFIVYIGELFLFLKALFTGSIKRPIITVKSLFLTLVSFVFLILFFAWTAKFVDLFQTILLLVFDFFAVFMVSAVVLFFQPFFVLFRKNVLRKAGKKIEKIKSMNKLKVIAITGSYGKTSTKEFLTKILSKKFEVLATKNHQNSEIGIAKCILENLKPEHQFFIAEVGAYNKGKVKEVCSFLKPDVGLVTGVNEQHMALFGSLRNLLSAEGGEELAEALPKNGILIVNGDNKYCLNLYKKSNNVRKKLYSLNNNTIEADIWAEDISIKTKYVSFVAVNRNKELMHFEAQVLGKQNVQNLLGAILTARELGMDFGEISEACKNIKQEQAGMLLQQGKLGIDIVDSSYSANPDGVSADLDYISIYPNKRIIIMPCLIELGERAGQIHEKIGKKIGRVCDMAIITSKDYFKEIKEGAVAGGMEEKKILLLENPQNISASIMLYAKSGDVVLLEGRVPVKLLNLLAE